MLGTVVAQQFPEIIRTIGRTSKEFNPDYNPLIRGYYFLDDDNLILHLRDFENQLEEIRHLMCDEGRRISATATVYHIFTVNQTVYEPLLSIINCIPDSYELREYYSPFSKLFLTIAKNKSGIDHYRSIQHDQGYTKGIKTKASTDIWVGEPLTSEQQITLSEALLKKGLDINYTVKFTGERAVDNALQQALNQEDYPNIEYLDWLLKHGGKFTSSDMNTLVVHTEYSRQPIDIFERNFDSVVRTLRENNIGLNTLYNYLLGRPVASPYISAAIRILREHGAQEGGRRRRATRVKRSKRATRRRKV
jgi:hypothetical protein